MSKSLRSLQKSSPEMISLLSSLKIDSSKAALLRKLTQSSKVLGVDLEKHDLYQIHDSYLQHIHHANPDVFRDNQLPKKQHFYEDAYLEIFKFQLLYRGNSKSRFWNVIIISQNCNFMRLAGGNISFWEINRF